jgi:PAS domain S-box-containing protein
VSQLTQLRHNLNLLSVTANKGLGKQTSRASRSSKRLALFVPTVVEIRRSLPQCFVSTFARHPPATLQVFLEPLDLMRFGSLRYFSTSAALVVIYVFAAALGLSLASAHNNVSPAWPPTGIAIAALLLFGVRLWPAIFFGALIANLRTDVSAVTAAGIAVGNTLEAVVACWLLNLNGPFDSSFSKLKDVLRFVVCASLIGPAVSATIGTTSLCLAGSASWNRFPGLWVTWWLGDAFGALVVAPFILAWSRKRSHSAAGVVESIVLLGLLFAVAMVLLGGWFPSQQTDFPLEHLCILFLLWAALRGNQQVVTSAILILSAIAVRGTAGGFGPFIKGSPNESLLLLQAFIASSTLAGLILFAVTREALSAHEEKEKLGSEIKIHQQRIEDIVAQAPGVVWEAWGEPDAATQRIDFVSNHVEQMLGYSEAEWLSTPNFWLTIVHPEDRERAAHEAATIFASGKGGTSRFRWQTKDGRDVWVDARSAVVCNDAGEPIGMRGVTIDITNAVMAEQERARLLKREYDARKEAEEASRLRDEFLATVSHELRTPLNAVVGWSRLLRTAQLDSEGVAHALEVIERNAWAQKQIIEDILDVSRIISGKLNLTFAPVDLLLVVHSAIDVVRPAADAKQIKIEVVADSPGVTIRGEADRLQQVAWNLLANAVKFTPNGGEIEISIQRSNTQVQLIVADSGPGVPPDFLPRVFERFSQADGSSTRRHGGLGLGLAIVRHLVEIHGGTVEATNRTDRSGAIFVVSLPISDSNEYQLLMTRPVIED